MTTLEELETRVIELESLMADMDIKVKDTDDKNKEHNKFIKKFDKINNLVVRSSESGKIALRDE